MEGPVKYKKILEVRNISQNEDFVVWCVHHQREDGVLWDYGFPAEALQNLSAEYGIDPADADTLLETYLYQFHMDPADLHHTHPHFVWNTTEDIARQHHLARVEQLKQQFRYHDPNGLLEQIKVHHLQNFDFDKHAHRVRIAASLRRQRVAELSRKNAL
jgi:hypothetical protein